MRLPRLRITLLNLMVAMVVLAITLAVTMPSTKSRSYIAVTWIFASSTNHDPATHSALSQDLTSDAVIRGALDDPNISGLPRFQGVSDPRKKLLEVLLIRVHPRDQGYIDPERELIWIGVESRSRSEANLLKDAFVHAYLKHHRLGKIIAVNPAKPERSNPPVFDRPWKFVSAIVLGLSLCITSLLIPLKRGRGRVLRMLSDAAGVGLVVGAIVWWLLSHPEFSWRVGGFRFF